MDWIKIKNEYINGDISYRKLADKYDVSFSTLQLRAKREGWSADKKTQHDKTTTKLRQKTADIIVKKEVDRITRIDNITDQLLDKLERATAELDMHLVRNKKKTKVIEYDNTVKKPSKEVIHEDETVDVISGNIDKQGLKQLTSALKDLRDIQQANKTVEITVNGKVDTGTNKLNDILEQLKNE